MADHAYLTPTDDGVYVDVHVQPGAHRVVGRTDEDAYPALREGLEGLLVIVAILGFQLGAIQGPDLLLRGS